jgi:hypothetical protein
VAQQLAHAGMDRREQVRVVVRRHLLEDARQALEAHPGVDARERQRDATVGQLVELHEHEVPDLEPARAVLEWSGMQCGPSDSCGRVEVDLAARAARSGVGHPPEVVVVAVVDVAPAAIRSGGRPISSRQIAQATSSSGVGRGGQPVAGDPEITGQKSQAQWMASRLK